MIELVVTTYDWVPEPPRGYVRDRFDGLSRHPGCRAFVARATARPAFVKAHADQIAHFAAADRS